MIFNIEYLSNSSFTRFFLAGWAIFFIFSIVSINAIANDEVVVNDGPVLELKLLGLLSGPQYDIRVYANRDVFYNGISNTKIVGERKYSLTPEQYDSLLELMNGFDFYKYSENRSLQVADGDMATITFVMGEKRKVAQLSRWDGDFVKFKRKIEKDLQFKSFLCPYYSGLDGKSRDICTVEEGLENSILVGKKNK